MNLYNTKSKIKILTLIKLCAHYSPVCFTLCVVLTVIDGLMVPFMLFTVAKFIDSAMTIASQSPEIKVMFIYLGLTVLGYLYTQLGQDFRQYSYDMLEDTLRRFYSNCRSNYRNGKRGDCRGRNAQRTDGTKWKVLSFTEISGTMV